MITTVLEDKTRFVGEFAHSQQIRFNTPVCIVSGYGQDVRTDVKTGQRLQSSVRQPLPSFASHLIRVMSDFNRLREPKKGNVTAEFKRFWEKAGVEMTFDQYRESVSAYLREDNTADKWLADKGFYVVIKPSPRIYLASGTYVIFR